MADLPVAVIGAGPVGLAAAAAYGASHKDFPLVNAVLHGVSAAAVGMVLAAASLGLRVPFLVYAVALLVAAGIVAVFLRHASLRPAPGSPALPVLTVSEAWRDSAYRAGLVSGFANGWGNFGVRNAILPLR